MHDRSAHRTGPSPTQTDSSQADPACGPEESSSPLRIEDYALIGDCETSALVGRDGSIDWLCWPRFDSGACFAALLGRTDNGRWKIAPTDSDARITRRYLPGTLILETLFETEKGSARLIDFMPLRDGTSDLVRIVEGVEGTVTFDFDLLIRFDYGRTVPWVVHLDDGTLVATAGPNRVLLRTSVPIHGEDMRTRACFTVSAGKKAWFRMSYQDSAQEPQAGADHEQLFENTRRYWEEFSDRCPDVGPWSEAVKRSLVTLKALTYQPTGGIVAAPTTSLPEWIGGTRNWDYRYCWLRDATFTLFAFMNLGYYEEAAAWRDWLLRAVAGDPAQLQIMYGLGGERMLPEWELTWLAGHHGSAPVRIGNAAHEQVQLDVYGEIADALTQAFEGGLRRHPRTRDLREVFMPFLEKRWDQPDEGIWEPRGGPRQYTHSKVMCWVAFDRAARLAEEEEDGAEAAHGWRATADRIHAEICEKAWDADLNSFVQTYGSKQLDASLLQMALVGFLPADDPRIRGTVDAIERKLMHHGLVRRYDPVSGEDGICEDEGTFLACSFWLVDNLVLADRREDAERLFRHLVSLCNDVGLLSEEYDPVGKRFLGNFPQAFSHVGLINSALNLARAAGPAAARGDASVRPDGDGKRPQQERHKEAT